jgi:hypothetical protein
MRVALPAAVLLASAGIAAAQSVDGRSYARELAADASARASALAREERVFTVDVHGYTQFRYVWTRLEEDDDGPIILPPGDDDDNAIGFQTARTRVNFSGNVVNENWGYFVQLAFNPESSGSLEDAYGTYKTEGGWVFTFGQFKLPLLREELVGEKFQLAIERSPTNSVFTQSRSQGVQAAYEADSFRFSAAFSDGLRTLNTDYLSAAEADFALTGRLEWKWAGDWKQFRDFTSFRNSDYAGLLGLAGHYQSGGETLGTPDADQWLITVDASMEGNGWNAFAAAIYSNREEQFVALPGFPSEDFNDWAWLVQGGIFVAPQCELFARFDMILPDDDREFGSDEFSTITAGINHYFVPESQAAKFTAEIIYFLDSPTESIVAENTRIPLLFRDGDGQFSILGQIQLAF